MRTREFTWIRAAPAGILPKVRRTLDPEALDWLDYFIHELKKNGIYTNLDLHVRNQSPEWSAVAISTTSRSFSFSISR